jgi:FixJ family two-component response regulator
LDDDPSVRKALGRLLRSADFDVASFASASELLAFERSRQPACLVLDLHLPDMHGLEILRHLVATAPDLPVVILTAESSPDIREQALRDGAAAFVVKPFEAHRLLEQVRRLVGEPGPSSLAPPVLGAQDRPE